MVDPNRSKIFIDTGGFIALIHKRDPRHEIAIYYYTTTIEKSRFFTTNMVISETYTWLRYHTSHSIAVKFLDILEKSAENNELKIIQVDATAEEKAKQILRKYSDQDFSYVDATSFVIMELLNIDHVFGFDSHFHMFGKNLEP